MQYSKQQLLVKSLDELTDIFWDTMQLDEEELDQLHLLEKHRQSQKDIKHIAFNLYNTDIKDEAIIKHERVHREFLK